MEEATQNINESKNISFPKSIMETMVSSLGQDYLNDVNKIAFDGGERMWVSRQDFIAIKNKYGVFLGNPLDEIILNSKPQKDEPVEEMSLAGKAISFVKAMTESAKTGFQMAPEQEVSKRKEICQACTYWVPDAYMGSGKCKICGCSGVKLLLATSSCPINKWTSSYSPNSES